MTWAVLYVDEFGEYLVQYRNRNKPKRSRIHRRRQHQYYTCALMIGAVIMFKKLPIKILEIVEDSLKSKFIRAHRTVQGPG